MGQRARRDSLLSAVVRETQRQGRAIERGDIEGALGRGRGILFLHGLPKPIARRSNGGRVWSFG
jgi:hypothetical protein